MAHARGRVQLQCLRVVVFMAVVSCTVDAVGGSEHRWRLQVGAAARMGTRYDVDWTPDSVLARIPAQELTSGLVAAPPPIGPANTYADRTYVDGYVRMDPGTTDPETDVYGMTWFWGYLNPAQYQGNAVVFRSAPVTQQASSYSFDPWQGRKEVDVYGISLSLDRSMLKRGRWTLEGTAGVTWYKPQHDRFEVQRHGQTSGSAWRYVDTYSAAHKPFPSAPYSGSYEGPGYLLNNIPDSRVVEQLDSHEANWKAVSELQLEMDMLEARLGVGAACDWGRLHMRIAPQFRIAHVTLSAESMTGIGPFSSGTIEASGQQREQEWIWGYGLEVAAALRLYRSWMVGASVSADWWWEDVTVMTDPFGITMDLGQWVFSANFGCEF